MLEFSISDQLLTRLDATSVFSDSENYLECQFTFSDDWEGLSAVAVFGHSQVSDPIPVPILGGVCRVPHEVIRPHRFAVAVYGVGQRGGEGFTHIPTNAATVEVGASGTSQGYVPQPPTPSLYDSLMAAIQEASEGAVAAQVSAQAGAGSALSSAQAAQDARGMAQVQAQAAEGSAQAALVHAQAAQRDALRIQAVGETVGAQAAELEQLRRRAEDGLVLHRSYLHGTEPFRVLAALRDLTWDGGEAQGPLLELQSGKRYLADVDGMRYEGISREIGQAAVNLLSLGPENAGEESGETPVIDPDDPIVDPGDDPVPAGLYRRVVELALGPVTLLDCAYSYPDEESGPGVCRVVSTGSQPEEIALLTDGEDNGRYFMEQCRGARNDAQEAAEAARDDAREIARLLEGLQQLDANETAF